MFQLTAKTGFAKGAAWVIPEDGLLIGRDPTCAVVVGDPIVSRRHCMLRAEDGRLMVEDLGSSNTTLVNGEPVTTQALLLGDEIAVGRATFLVSTLSTLSMPPQPESLDHPTKSLRSGEVLYLNGDEQQASLKGQPRTVKALARLFAIARSLSECTTQTGLEQRLLHELQQDFPNTTLMIGYFNETGLHLVREMGAANIPDKEREFLQTTLTKAYDGQQALLIPRVERTPNAHRAYVAMAAPITFASERIAAIGLVTDGETVGVDENDLEYFFAAASASAAHFVAVERVEVLQQELARLKHVAHQGVVLVGHSKAIARVRGMARVAARSTMPVLITGETGTGKELVAQMIQQLSERVGKPYEVVNCAAIPEELFESEVFGYDKHAFTGAGSARAGIFEQCDGGVLFLDEIGDLSLRNQARLLRAVETLRFRRVGGRGEHQVDVRFVAATNKNLDIEIKEGRFRNDLFHRLAGIEIQLPSLEQRRSDIPDLVRYFFQEARYSAKRPVTGIDDHAVDFLRRRTWRGNVRELRHVVHRAVLLASRDILGVAELQAACRVVNEESFLPLTLDENERLHISKTLEACGGVVPEAAQVLGVSRSTLYRKLSEYGSGAT